MAWLERLLPFLVIGCCIAVVFWGRRKGLDRHSANMAAARAEGAAELRAQLTNSVTVVAGNQYGSTDSPGQLPADVSRFADYDRRNAAGLSAADLVALDAATAGDWLTSDDHDLDDDDLDLIAAYDQHDHNRRAFAPGRSGSTGPDRARTRAFGHRLDDPERLRSHEAPLEQ